MPEAAIWNENALRTTWEAARRPKQTCCNQGAVGIQIMAMAPRFILEAFGKNATKPFFYTLLTCLICRHGIDAIPDPEQSNVQDLPWRPPHVMIPDCICKPPAPGHMLDALTAHDKAKPNA